MIRFKCPSCQKVLQVADNAAGKNAKCKCGQRIKIPKPKAPTPATDPVVAKQSLATKPPSAQAAHPETPFGPPPPNPPASVPAAASQPVDPLAHPMLPVDSASGSPGAFADLPDFLAPTEPVAQPTKNEFSHLMSDAPGVGSNPVQPVSEMPAPSGPVISQTPDDLAGALDAATASIDAAVQAQMQRNAYAVGAKMTPAQISGCFTGDFEPIQRDASYEKSLSSASLAVLLLPTAFVALVVAATALMTWLIYGWFSSESETGQILNPMIFFAVAIAVLLLLACWIPVFSMIGGLLRLLFSSSDEESSAIPLTRENQPVMYEFVDQICDRMSAPKPKRIDLICDYNAYASVDGHWSKPRKDNLVLAIGVPMIASHSAEELASVIAHEFGHFCQTDAMRANFLIRNLNSWFVRSAIIRTINDEVGGYIQQNSEYGAGIFWSLKYVISVLGRNLLWWFGKFGNSISGGLSREMEYDADKYAVHLAGTQAFATSSTKEEKFGSAYSVTIHNLKLLYGNGVLVNNIPRLMLHIGKTMPAEAVRDIAKREEERKQEAMDTHPPTRDRVAHARKLNKSGIIRVGRPAQDLVDHWTQLCEAITLKFYRQVTNQEFTKEQMTPLEDILRAEHKLLLDKT